MRKLHRKFSKLVHPADLFVGTFITVLGRGSKIWTPQSYLLSDLKSLLRHDPSSQDILLENLLYKTAPTQLSDVCIPLSDFLMVTLA